MQLELNPSINYMRFPDPGPEGALLLQRGSVGHDDCGGGSGRAGGAADGDGDGGEEGAVSGVAVVAVGHQEKGRLTQYGAAISAHETSLPPRERRGVDGARIGTKYRALRI
ncbi:hypothetical protein C4D60_Mb04t29410 [Musa balbisiana]|uniref:Uncharacterized protein n=1 Tax=Musa balbisiana TaxID=52838 RepID=A0A4S8KFI1_MUSBA|nr:hypothetical protein C4D60_Mb04t29410 [Musa balbisiana]